MKRFLLAMLGCAGVVIATPAVAEVDYLYGQLTNVTSTPSGLMIQLSTGVPTNCAGVGNGWMTVPEANKTMIAAALIAWQTQVFATVYTNALSGGVCVINQFDPH